MLINIIIPVCSLHIKYINTLITSINNQTRKPDKVIFILNEYSRYSQEYNEIIHNNSEFCYIKIDVWKTAGENRNIGYDYVIKSNESIALFYDVDDIMSNYLCEIVENVFEKHKCDMLIYGSTVKLHKLVNTKKSINNILTPNITSDLFKKKIKRKKTF